MSAFIKQRKQLYSRQEAADLIVHVRKLMLSQDGVHEIVCRIPEYFHLFNEVSIFGVLVSIQYLDTMLYRLLFPAPKPRSTPCHVETGCRCFPTEVCLPSFTLLTYKCNDPKIDESTQEPENCRDMTAWGESHFRLDFFLFVGGGLKKQADSKTEDVAELLFCRLPQISQSRETVFYFGGGV